MKTVQRFLKRVKHSENILFLFLANKLCLTPLQMPDSSAHGISEARIQKWIAISFSRGSSQPKDGTHVSCVSCIAGRFRGSQEEWPALSQAEQKTSQAKDFEG